MQNNLGQIKPVVFAAIWRPPRQFWCLRKKGERVSDNSVTLDLKDFGVVTSYSPQRANEDTSYSRPLLPLCMKDDLPALINSSFFTPKKRCKAFERGSLHLFPFLLPPLGEGNQHQKLLLAGNYSSGSA